MRNDECGMGKPLFFSSSFIIPHSSFAFRVLGLVACRQRDRLIKIFKGRKRWRLKSLVRNLLPAVEGKSLARRARGRKVEARSLRPSQRKSMALREHRALQVRRAEAGKLPGRKAAGKKVRRRAAP